MSDEEIYYCYHCQQPVSIHYSESGELICDNCNDSFIEIQRRPPPQRGPIIISGSESIPLASLFSGHRRERNPIIINSRSGGDDGDGLGSLLAFFSGGMRPSRTRTPFADIMQLLMAHDEETESPVVVNGQTLNTFEEIVNYLMSIDQNNHGTPPASKEVVKSLPVIKLTASDLSEEQDCAVCKDPFKEGDEAMKIPCNHMFHPDCIKPWLDLHNSCPVCRYELKTDDADYERQKQQEHHEQPYDPPQ